MKYIEKKLDYSNWLLLDANIIDFDNLVDIAFIFHRYCIFSAIIFENGSYRY